MVISIRNLNIPELKEYLGVLKTLVSSVNKTDHLNAYFLYSSERDRMYLIKKDASFFASIELPCTLDVQGDNKLWGVHFGISTLQQILNYTESEKDYSSSLSIELSGDNGIENSFYRIKTTYDNISLPHNIIAEEQCRELFNLIDSSFVSDHFTLSEFGGGQSDLLQGFSQAMDFLPDVDDKNNAVSIFRTWMVANIKKHIFVYKFSEPFDTFKEDEPYIIHKSILRVILQITSKKSSLPMDILFSKKRDKIGIEFQGLSITMNNNLAKSAPPRPLDLIAISPDMEIATLPVVTMYNTSVFFQGFYPSSMELYPIQMELIPNEGIKYTIKSIMPAGNLSRLNCLGERLVPIENFSGVENNAITILNDSLLTFLKVCMSGASKKEEDTISIWMDNKHPALVLKCRNCEIYLAKVLV